MPVDDDVVAPELRQYVQALDDAFNRGDVEGVLGFYAPDALMVVAPSWFARGTAMLREAFTHLVREGGQAQVLESRVLAAGDVALFVARWQLRQQTSGDTLPQTATSVFRRGADGQWRLQIDNAFGPRILEVT